MGVTIKEIAQQSGVSIATVSHIINKTRYVSPELAKKVQDVIEKTGYKAKIAQKADPIRMGKNSVLALVVPAIDSALYPGVATHLNKLLLESGYMLAVYVTDNDVKKEKHILRALMANKIVAGIFLSPLCESADCYKKLLRSRIPLVCINHGLPGVTSVTGENVSAMYMGTLHLLRRGHKAIALVVGSKGSGVMKKRCDGYSKALFDNNIFFDDTLVIEHDSFKADALFEAALRRIISEKNVTAFIAGSNRLTLKLLTAFANIGIDCPRDVSVVGFGDEKWSELVTPPLTTLVQNTEKIAAAAAEKMLMLIGSHEMQPEQLQIPLSLTIRKSTQMISRGPFGETAYMPEDITFSAEEKRRLQSGNFKAAISFHYSGTAWTHLHETAIRTTLENFGISVISVTDANFDPSLQVTQLDAIQMQKPDMIIAIPADDRKTAEKFKEISRKTKLVFISSVPEGLSLSDYASLVSVNERENGLNAAVLMGEYYKNRESVNVGLVQHGARFYGTSLRDMTAEQTLREQYKNVKITSIVHFSSISGTYAACRDMLQKNPNIEALYVSWDRPALEVIRALKDLGRGDVDVFTFDLDLEIAKYFARGEFVKGLSTQRPYEQGEAVAIAAAKALVSDKEYKYISVAPYVITQPQLLRAWKDIMHSPVPKELADAVEQE